MTSHEILKADLLDILFDNRNKQYGAYALRKDYTARLTGALVITLGMGCLLIFFMNPKTNQVIKPDVGIPDVILRTVPILSRPTPPSPPAQKLSTPKKAAETSYERNIKLVENPSETKKMQTIDDIRNAVISSGNFEGPVVENIQPVTATSGKDLPQSTAESKQEATFVPLENGPEFPGGKEAWANFLNRYLQTPADLEPGEKKMVLIRFLVDADGSVTGFQVMQSGGKEFDNEVIRVLKKMPKWKPARQNGHTVAVPFTQSVTFVGVEQ